VISTQDILEDIYIEVYPDRITHDWLYGEHLDDIADYVEEYQEDMLNEFILNKITKNKVLVAPEDAELYNHLGAHETSIHESNDRLTLNATYKGEHYEVNAIPYLNSYLVVSIYNKDSNKELSTLVDYIDI
jgi:hypothetical protein